MLPVCLIICQLGRTTEVPSTPTIRRGLHGGDFGGYTRYANSQRNRLTPDRAIRQYGFIRAPFEDPFLAAKVANVAK